ncbi:hypothetical protein QBC37DRAFT_478164 [Rhypophila decipiens]|uniref:Uncharacterized protein n=1 Tax=Rhypophila decipiens TaxID=261697 RepID=A0AAN7BCT4_9PEZI|nr:hypothetical protein QBC37DRAFT_478164 [Rhypophila decipiens]
MAWHRLLSRAAIAGLLAMVGTAKGQETETGNHPDWPRWCGKVYEAGYPAFDPGGQTVEPAPHPDAPLLHIQIKPRYNLYLSSEDEAELIVRSEISPYHGTPWNTSSSSSDRANWFIFTVNLVDTDDVIISNKIIVNNTSTEPQINILSFPLSRLGKPPSLKPIELVLYGAPEGGHPTWTTTTSILYLPDRGAAAKRSSVTKIDNLSGSLFFRPGGGNSNNSSSSSSTTTTTTTTTFEPFFPYGFFASYDGFLGRNDSTAQIQAYHDLGFNAMTPLTNYSGSERNFEYMDELGLRIMYNLRENYKNLDYVREQVESYVLDSEGVFAYWSTDEPDGWQDPFHFPSDAYTLLHALDPYHPVALVLNCQNYYFPHYSSPSDIIMSDVYPIGINATFSKWNTSCTPTLGDCGCDNCAGNLQDVPNRLDDLSRYEKWLGLWPKTKMHNPQSFHGQDYWLRDPSREETYVMALLAVNHGAKGLISWVWPASDLLGRAHGGLAKVLTRSPVVELLLGKYYQARGYVQGDGGPFAAKVVVTGNQGIEVVDAAFWVRTEDSGKKKMLLSVVNGGYVDINSLVSIKLPVNGGTIESIPWDNGGSQKVEWKLERSTLTASRLPALGTFLLVLDLFSV